MKRRTRVTAWIFVIWLLVGLPIQVGLMSYATKDPVTLAFGLLFLAMWGCVLMKKQWARNALLVLLVPVLARGLYITLNSTGARQTALWYGFGFIVLIVGWEAFVLLTENPSKWGKDS